MKTILLKKEIFLSLIILIFCNTAINAQAASSGPNPDVQSFQLEFNNVNGPAANRVLDLNFRANATDTYDESHDSKNLVLMADDFNLEVNGEYYTTKVFSPITEDKTIDLVFQSSGDYDFTVQLTAMDNMGDRNIELRDNLLGIVFNLRSGDSYQFSSVAGFFPGRFQLTFKTTTLSQSNFDVNSINVRFANELNAVVIKNPTNLNIDNVEVYAITGQRVYADHALTNDEYIKYPVKNMNPGLYIIKVTVDGTGSLNQKVLVQ